MKKFFYTSLIGVLSPFLLYAGAADTQKFAEQVATDYQQGRYRSFLKESHEAYQKSEKKWEHDTKLEERKIRSEALRSSIQNQKDSVKQLKKEGALKVKRNRELLDSALLHPNDLKSQEVKEMVLFTPTKEDQAAIDYVEALKNKFKGEGTSPIENRLIAIDIEFWLKTLGNEALFAMGSIDYDLFRKQHLVLQLEKVSQMRTACQEQGTDPIIKTAIERAAEIWLSSEAAQLTERYLKALEQDKVSPTCGYEESLKAIMTKYQ